MIDGDRSTHKLKLTPILAEGRMREILEEVLEKRGWSRRDDGTWEKVNEAEDGAAREVMVCDPDSMEVTTNVEASEEIRKERTVHATGDAWNPREVQDARAKLRDEVERRLEQDLHISEAEKKAHEQELQQKLAHQLAAGQAGRGRELNEIVMEVYVESLKEKAKSLGEITEIHESRDADGVGYELTIKIAE